MRYIAVMFLVVCLNSCTFIVGTYSPTTAAAAPIYGCSQIVTPVLAPMPDVPVIPAHLAKNREATDDILINNISELRQYIKDIKRQYATAIDAHLKSCQ